MLERFKERTSDVLKNHTAEVAWGVIGAGVLAYELAAPHNQMLSHAADRAIEKYPVATTVAIGAVALHLANLLPGEADVLAIMGGHLERYKGRGEVQS